VNYTSARFVKPKNMGAVMTGRNCVKQEKSESLPLFPHMFLCHGLGQQFFSTFTSASNSMESLLRQYELWKEGTV
jgi:hypothetical protein